MNDLPPTTRHATDRARALHAGGRTDEAIEVLRAELARGDTHPFLVSFLGGLEFFCGQVDIGLEHGAQAAAEAPRDPVILGNYGAQLLAAGKIGDAIRVLGKVVRLQPRPGEAHLKLAMAYCAGERFAQAEKLARACIAANPQDARGYGTLYETLLRSNRFDAAEETCRQLLARDPSNGAALVAMIDLFIASGALEKARQCIDDLLENRPALVNDVVLARSVELTALLRGPDVAAGTCAALLRRHPDAPTLASTQRWMLLLAGRLGEGWRAFGQDGDRAKKIGALPHPAWNGEDLAGRTLLVRGAEGVGEQLMYSQLLPQLRRRAGHLIVECDRRLLPLLARSFPDIEFVAWNTPPHPRLLQSDIDLQCLPRETGQNFLRTAADIRGPEYPLTGSPEGLAAARSLRERYPGKRLVGISWRSSSGMGGGLKSVPLIQWADILTCPGVQFVNLQYGSTESEIGLVRDRLGIAVASADGIDTTDDIDRCVGLIGGLDLVLTISNVTAHYAGNAGTPAWIMLGKLPLWQWFADRDDSPWYPGARLYRQRPADTWEPVLKRVAADLRTFAG